MTLEQYIANGGDREEKLVVIYKTDPSKLTPSYKGLLDALDSENKYLVAPIGEAFPLIHDALLSWREGRIQKDLDKQGADFV